MRDRLIVATYDFRWGHGSDCEIIRRGQVFAPGATAQASAEEHARALIRNGVGRSPTAEQVESYTAGGR